jgi:hypothetical protein
MEGNSDIANTLAILRERESQVRKRKTKNNMTSSI